MKISFSIIFIAFLFVLINCKSEKKEQPLPPNIIFVLADDMGYGDVSAYAENNKIKTPNIDKMAAEGIRFTDAHTSSSVCTPTRYGLLTGRYNWRTRLKNGVLTGNSRALIPTTRSTVASILQKKGYHTAFIGKWHLGWNWGLKDSTIVSGEGWNPTDFDNIDFSKPITHNPNDLGFNYAYGHAGSLDMAPYVYVENGQSTRIPDSVTVNKGKYSWWREGPTAKDFVHEDVTPNFFRKAMSYVEERSKKQQPFFLYLPLPSPHTPILPTENWQGKSEINPYGDFVMMIDDYMGKLLATIQAEGIEENTLILFSTDNGCSPAAKIEELVEKGHYPNHIYRGHKADIFEGGHRVPFIAKWPNTIKKGSVSEETICLTDFLATCADIVDYDLSDEEGEDSYSLLPIFEGKELTMPLREATIHHSINGSFAIRKEEWKLIMCPGSGGWSFPRPSNKSAIDSLPSIQLYNLKTDPKETINLQAKNIEKVNELKTLLIKYIQEGRSTEGKPQENDAIIKKWKQIGFMEKE